MAENAFRRSSAERISMPMSSLRAANGGQLVLVDEADGREVTVPLADSARPRR